IGWPVEHSRSPAMMNAAFEALGLDATMSPRGVPPDQLAGAIAELRALPALGASVTIPHKEALLALADDLTADVVAIGAANCLQFDRGRVIAHNTDAAGFADSLPSKPHHAVILGAGGAARAVAYALRDVHVEVVARRPAEWTASRPWSELASALAG